LAISIFGYQMRFNLSLNGGLSDWKASCRDCNPRQWVSCFPSTDSTNEQAHYECNINVILFTLPSNVDYITHHLVLQELVLLDPIPPYDPARHADTPVYQNGHGGGDLALRILNLIQSRRLGMGTASVMDKAKQVDVQRQQVDEVFKSIDDGQELEHTDPGELPANL